MCHLLLIGIFSCAIWILWLLWIITEFKFTVLKWEAKTSKHMTPLPKSECFYEQSVKSMPAFCPCSDYIIEIIKIVISIDGLRVSIPIWVAVRPLSPSSSSVYFFAPLPHGSIGCNSLLGSKTVFWKHWKRSHSLDKYPLVKRILKMNSM